MTLLRTRSQRTEPAPTTPSAAAAEAPSTPETPATAGQVTTRRLVLSGLGWLAALVVGVLVATGPLGALRESRAQHDALIAFQSKVSRYAAAAKSPLGAIADTKVPAAGTSVALLQIPRLRLQRVVVEGATPTITRDGPGHIPGTAGLGQPGNSGLIGRSAGYGGAFARLDKLRPGDAIVVTTVQGQSVYLVRTTGVVKGGDPLAPSRDDRLTLLTNGSASPLNRTRALVITAAMRDRPFAPTPQGGRVAATDGRQGDPAAYGWLLIDTVLLVGSAALAVVLYRRFVPRVTYVLTAPVLVTLLILTTDQVMRLTPAWV